MRKSDDRTVRRALRTTWWERNVALVIVMVVCVLFTVMLGVLGLTRPPPRVEHGVWVLFIANTVRTWRVAALPDSTPFLLPHLIKTWLIPDIAWFRRSR